MIKYQILDQLLVDWFTKSKFPPIAHDVSMGGDITKEQAISHAQYINLVYSQSGTLYELIPNTPRPTNDPSRPTPELHFDSLIGSIKHNHHHLKLGTKSHPLLPQLLPRLCLIPNQLPLLLNPSR